MRQKTKGRATGLDSVIGDNLRQLRQKQGITQQQIGDMIDVTFQQIQKYERGANRISAAHLYRLSLALDVDIRDFYRQR